MLGQFDFLLYIFVANDRADDVGVVVHELLVLILSVHFTAIVLVNEDGLHELEVEAHQAAATVFEFFGVVVSSLAHTKQSFVLAGST